MISDNIEYNARVKSVAMAKDGRVKVRSVVRSILNYVYYKYVSLKKSSPSQD